MSFLPYSLAEAGRDLHTWGQKKSMAILWPHTTKKAVSLPEAISRKIKYLPSTDSSGRVRVSQNIARNAKNGCSSKQENVNLICTDKQRTMANQHHFDLPYWNYLKHIQAHFIGWYYINSDEKSIYPGNNRSFYLHDWSFLVYWDDGITRTALPLKCKSIITCNNKVRNCSLM